MGVVGCCDLLKVGCLGRVNSIAELAERHIRDLK